MLFVSFSLRIYRGAVTCSNGREEPAQLIARLTSILRQPTPHYASTGEIVTHKNHLAHNNFSVRGLRSHPTTLWNSESFNSHIILLRNRPQRGSFNFVIRSRDWTLHPHPRPESCLRVRPLGQPTRLRSASMKLGARLPEQAPLPFSVRRE